MLKRLLNKLFGRAVQPPQGGKRAGLAVEVSACLPALEILNKQILSVADKGDHSTGELSRSFAEMASRTNELVVNVTGGPHDDSEIENVQTVLSLLLSKFQESNRATAATGETLSAIEQELKNVETCAAEVADISRRARLVSLNGRIEAQRAGEHGEGFAVVAEETGKLALTVAKTSREIGESVSRLTATLRATSEEMQTLVQHGSATADECEQNVNETLGKLMVYQNQLEGNLESAKTTGDSLSNSISRSIIGLQFQDAASQRIHHVSEAIEDIRLHLSDMVPSNAQTEGRSKQWLDKIAANYCVAEEHEVHAGNTDTTTANDMSNVELF